MTYQVTALKMGQCDVPGPEVYWMSDWERWYTLFFYMIVLQGPGVTAIINTGPPDNLTALNNAWRAGAGDRGMLVRQETERPAVALSALGLTTHDVSHVLITPLQAYATANIPLFTRAQIFLSKRGWIEDFHAPKFATHVRKDLRIPDEVLQYLLFDGRDAVRLLEDEDEVVPGVRAFWAGAHHRSSMVYLVDTAIGRVAMTDTVFHYGNLEDMRPLGINESMEEVFTTYARLKREADIVIPLYDPEVLQRFPGGRIA